MKSLRNILLLIYVLILLISCFAPPDDVKTTDALNWISKVLTKLNAVNLNEEKQKTFVKDEIQINRELIAFYKDYSINLHSKEEKISDFFYSIDNNGFILKRPIYVTYEDNEMYISFEKKTWILIEAMSSDTDFVVDYKFESKINEKNKSIDIYFTLAATLKDELKHTKELKKQKPLINLDGNMTLMSNKDKSSVTIDLKKNILFIPADTILTGDFTITGNILKTIKTDGALSITALKNIFIYINKSMLNLSFDRKTWGLATIFSLKFDSSAEVKTKENNKIFFCITADVRYKE